ncbi:MAG TPA: ABC transporter ATP-binding protein [Candidatus Tectomicrobia bacterium]
MLIQTFDLRKTYQMGHAEVHALRGVRLEVAHGEFVAIMGPSGSGKSTLLHLLGCLDRPSEGWYHLDGMTIESLHDAELSRLRNKRIGFVFQGFNLIPQHNVLENVELPLIYGGMERRNRRETSLEILHQVGLGEKISHKPTELSGGEAQRVAIARALVIRPLLLLADEPTGNLDSQTGEDIMKLFADLNRVGTTILMVTHNRDVAAHSARIIDMMDGRIVGDSKGTALVAQGLA